MLLYFAFFVHFISLTQAKDTEENAEPTQDQVVVRAVFINCELNEEQDLSEVEATRFQREELFKHSALQGCHKKLALTVKIASEPDKSSGDEYIPIEHVFDGASNKRRVRLLNPYILRLRRDTPLQAYKLRRIDTVTGILTKPNERRSGKSKKNRVQRNLDELSNQKNCRDTKNNEEFKGSVRELQPLSSTDGLGNTQEFNHCGIREGTNLSNPIISMKAKGSTLFDISSIGGDNEEKLGEIFSKHVNNQDQDIYIKENARVKRDSCTLANNPAWKRDKRHEHNIIVEDITDDYKIPWTTKNRFYRRLDRFTKSTRDMSNEDHEQYRSNDEELKVTRTKTHSQNTLLQGELQRDSPERQSKLNRENLLGVSTEDKTELTDESYHTKEFSTRRVDKKTKNSYFKNKNFETVEKKFVLYDIGNPDLWYTVHVQLFEKFSTSEGKTLWNDITKGEVARVSTIQPEWTDQDINVRYKSTEWMTKDEFTLPSDPNLCLLAPILNEETNNLENFGKYIVVPKEDIVSLDDNVGIFKKRDGNYSEATTSDSSIREEQGHRRVLIRVSRALLADTDEELKISTVGTERFLTLRHRRAHHAQIDLEARADENQLIRVGSSGSLMTIVSDNSPRTRSVITIQATNKGLAAARFRVRARDCGPEMASVINEKSNGLSAGPVLVPPRHTQRFRLELPTGVPVDTIHCSVALINDDDESVAVRDVAIRKGDRCFCVWHCDCVCLDVDPKLSCREMPEARQTAAGLPPRERARRARSICYPDCVTINLFVIIIGVLMTLLLLGLVKACFGLFCRCVGKWGLDRLLQTPRKLEHYFEPSLQCREVVYDEEGWPVHPDTMKRNVRLISKSMEFVLNVIFFIMLPCLLIRDAIIQLLCRSNFRRCDTSALGNDDKKCFSTHDMQGAQPRWRRRRGGLRRWMTPQAEELSTDIWTKGLMARKSVECEFMRPLLHKRRGRTDDAPSSCADSEQDDTEYVLMQMQKSRESLARSQKKINEASMSPPKSHPATEKKASQSITR